MFKSVRPTHPIHEVVLRSTLSVLSPKGSVNAAKSRDHKRFSEKDFFCAASLEQCVPVCFSPMCSSSVFLFISRVWDPSYSWNSTTFYIALSVLSLKGSVNAARDHKRFSEKDFFSAAPVFPRLRFEEGGQFEGIESQSCCLHDIHPEISPNGLSVATLYLSLHLIQNVPERLIDSFCLSLWI